MTNYLEWKFGEVTEYDYIALIAAIKPTISHQGEMCPAEPMRYLIMAAEEHFPDSEILQRMRVSDGQGRTCESGEIHYLATKWLEDHKVPDRKNHDGTISTWDEAQRRWVTKV